MNESVLSDALFVILSMQIRKRPADLLLQDGMEETKMEFTFGYDVRTADTGIVIAAVGFGSKLTEDQAARLTASYCSGNYSYLDGDGSISDIYELIYASARRNASADFGADTTVVHFRYPAELRYRALLS